MFAPLLVGASDSITFHRNFSTISVRRTNHLNHSFTHQIVFLCKKKFYSANDKSFTNWKQIMFRRRNGELTHICCALHTTLNVLQNSDVPDKHILPCPSHIAATGTNCRSLASRCAISFSGGLSNCDMRHNGRMFRAV